jgi:rifampicin phosphotransferase
VFEAPQDVEWAFDDAGRLWLLQSRPVTAVGDRPAHDAALLGPGPVAETFPAPLRPLEVDLWVAPLAAGVAEALHLAGSASRRRLERSPVVTTVGGRIAADLELLGTAPATRRALAGLAPLTAGRHLAAAWRVGRLRTALPALVTDLVSATDAALAAVPALSTLDDDELLLLLRRCTQALVAVHGHEALAGALLGRQRGSSTDATTTAAAVALRALAAGRSAGLTDDALVVEHPAVLALVPPRIGALPAFGEAPPGRRGSVDLAALSPREALRLRTRWLQELTARAAAELGARLHAAGRLDDVDAVAHLTTEELVAAVAGEHLPADLAARVARPSEPPLPAAFRLTPSGNVRAATDRPTTGAGTGASSGRVVGTVVDTQHVLATPNGLRPVLVTRTLDPDLSTALPHVAGLVAETGSVLSHLAILARELHVPTVVSVPDAVRRFPPGSTVLLDGESGEVAPAEPVAAVVEQVRR